MDPWGTPASLGSPRKGAILGSFRGPLGEKPRNGGSLGYRHRLPDADWQEIGGGGKLREITAVLGKLRPISSTIGPARFHSIYESFYALYVSHGGRIELANGPTNEIERLNC